MKLLTHNLKIAIRNLAKYKLQTTISILSMAIGIVTLATAHAVLKNMQLPAIFSTPQFDRTYAIRFSDIDDEFGGVLVTQDIFRALKNNGGLKCSDGEVVHTNGGYLGISVTQFRLGDTLRRKKEIEKKFVDPRYPRFAGYHSALTGKPVKELKAGEAIISEKEAKKVFGDINPVGAVFGDWSCGTEDHYKIVDVYQDLSNFERFNADLMLCYGELDANTAAFQNFYGLVSFVVLKDGYTIEQLEKEVNECIKPQNKVCSVRTAEKFHEDDVKNIFYARMFFYGAGVLILLASIIGFLRMQIQLFWMRGREMSLRIVNGAKRGQLFLLLIMEVVIVILMASVMSCVLGIWLNDFILENMSAEMDNSNISLDGVMYFCMVVGGILFLVCCVIVWFTLRRICKSENGLVVAMRNSRTHRLRNSMLCFQVAVSMFFIAGACVFSRFEKAILNDVSIPENADYYKKCFMLDTSCADDAATLCEGIKRLPAVKDFIPLNNVYSIVQELSNDSLQRYISAHVFESTDTRIIDFFKIDCKWYDKESAKEGILINRDLYDALVKNDIDPHGVLHLSGHNDSPIIGTFEQMPYERPILTDMGYLGNSVILISPVGAYNPRFNNYIIEPKEGKAAELKAEVENTISRLEPAVVTSMIERLDSKMARGYSVNMAMRNGVWILAVVSLIICAMNIFSTIALDTRSRRKEMAIRKVNGAKGRDIACLFGKLYIAVCLIAILLAVPLTYVFGTIIQDQLPMHYSVEYLQLPLCIVIGILTVITITVLIVSWHVKSIMKVNPADIVVKE